MGSGAGGAIACAGGSSGGASESAGGASGAAESQSDFVKYGYRAIVSASTGGGEIQSRAPSVEEGDRSRVKLNKKTLVGLLHRGSSTRKRAAEADPGTHAGGESLRG